MKLGLFLLITGGIALIIGVIAVSNTNNPISLYDSYKAMLYGNFYPISQSALALAIPCITFGYIRIVNAILDRHNKVREGKGR